MQGSSKPPKQSYDAKRDETTYSTGDIRTGGLTGMSAQFSFPGKTPVAPKFINLGIGALRVKKDESASDESLVQWSKVNEAHFKAGDQEIDLPATPGWQVSKNSMVTMFYGHAVEEFADVHLSPAQFQTLAESKGWSVGLGKREGSTFTEIESRTIKEGQTKQLLALEASVPRAVRS
jgi:hypothetical protein